jgi:multiple sugar transport system substrate-binding protein
MSPGMRTPSRRAVLSGIAALSAVPVLAACGGSGSTGASAPAAQLRSGVTLTYLAWGAATSDTDKAFAASRFPELQPGIKVDLTGLEGNAEFDAKVVAMIAGGTPPDVIQVGGRNFGLYAAKSMALDLEPYAKRDKESLDAFLPVTVEFSKWQNKLYAYPNDFNCLAMYTNVELFESAGVPLPPTDWKASGWTWQQFVEAGLRLTRRDSTPGRFALASLPTGVTNVAPWIWANGADFVSKDGAKVVLDQAPAVEALQYLQDLRQRHRFVPDASETGGVTGNDIFLNGMSAILIAGAAYTATARRRITNFRWNATVFPAGRAGRFSSTGGTQGSSWMIPAASNNKNEAWAFTRFLSGDEMQQRITSSGLIGARKSAATAARQLNAGQPPANWGLFLDGEPFTRAVPSVPQWAEFDRTFNAEVAKALAGQAAPRETGARLKELLEPLLRPAG